MNEYPGKQLTQKADKVVALTGLGGRFRDEIRKMAADPDVLYITGL